MNILGFISWLQILIPSWMSSFWDLKAEYQPFSAFLTYKAESAQLFRALMTEDLDLNQL